MNTGHDQENRIHVEGFGAGDIAMLKTIAQEASEQTAKRLLTLMGMEPDKPIEMQTTFALLRELIAEPSFRADLTWTRRTRLRMEGFVGKALITAVGCGVLAGAQLLWAGAKTVVAAVAVNLPQGH